MSVKKFYGWEKTNDSNGDVDLVLVSFDEVTGEYSEKTKGTISSGLAPNLVKLMNENLEAVAKPVEA